MSSGYMANTGVLTTLLGKGDSVFEDRLNHASLLDAGATASDTEDGDLTASNVVGGDVVDTNTVGAYVITYDVTDSDGNAAAQVTRTVNVTADSAPVITLVGGNVTLTVGDAYTEQGATATDAEDGDLTANIVITGNVNTAVAGTYTVRYNVTDSAGNAATEVTRTVTVNAKRKKGGGGNEYVIIINNVSIPASIAWARATSSSAVSRSCSVRLRKLRRSSASDAFEISSRRKISLLL